MLVCSIPYCIAALSTSIFISVSVLNLMQYPVTLALPSSCPNVWVRYLYERGCQGEKLHPSPQWMGGCLAYIQPSVDCSEGCRLAVSLLEHDQARCRLCLHLV